MSNWTQQEDWRRLVWSSPYLRDRTQAILREPRVPRHLDDATQLRLLAAVRYSHFGKLLANEMLAALVDDIVEIVLTVLQDVGHAPASTQGPSSSEAPGNDAADGDRDLYGAAG